MNHQLFEANKEENRVVNWFSLTLKLNGFPIKEAQQTLRELKAIPEEAYPQYVEEKKQEILQHHLEHNPFYKTFCGNEPAAEWRDLPIMTKRDLQQPLDLRLSEGFSPKDIYVGKTSGSSGTPFIFGKDRFCHALSWAEFFHCYKEVGIDLNNSKQARFYGIPLNPSGYAKERIKDRLGNRFRFSIFKLDEEKMENFLRDFSRKKFRYINGYTSPIVFFAKFLQQRGIILKDICPSLKLCIVTSEMFFAEDKELLEKQFGVPVINEYGASEFGLLAFENPQQEWLLTNETKYIEIVNDKGEVLPDGKEGRIVITSLYNKAHPFIRYDIGDRGVIEPRGSAKKRMLRRLLGRANDVAVLPSGKVVPGLAFYYVTKTVIENEQLVKEFVVQQLTPRKFRITYVAKEVLAPAKIREIEQAMLQYLEEGLEVEFQQVTSLHRNKRGKLQQFESLL